MKRSPLLTAVPACVVKEMCPDPVNGGMIALMVVAVTAGEGKGGTGVTFMNNLSFCGSRSKLVPVMAMVAPVLARVGENPVMVGGFGLGRTVKLALLVAVPAGVVTATSPVVAPVGTEVTIWFDVEETTVAAVPLKLTLF